MRSQELTLILSLIEGHVVTISCRPIPGSPHALMKRLFPLHVTHAHLAKVETCLYFGSRSWCFLENRTSCTCSVLQLMTRLAMLFCLHDIFYEYDRVGMLIAWYFLMQLKLFSFRTRLHQHVCFLRRCSLESLPC